MLTRRQEQTLLDLQRKTELAVRTGNSLARINEAQYKVMQAALNKYVADGREVPAEVKAAATRMGFTFK